MKHEYDLSLLINERGYAVHCPNADDAVALLEQIRQTVPEKCSLWTPRETHYYMYGENTAYTFCYPANSDPSTLKYGSIQSLVEMGYKILEILDIFDTTDIAESDESLALLFGT
jgi:hypothetical protein